MEAEDILGELKDIMQNDKVSKDDLMVILKRYAGIISPFDLMMATALMRKDGEYIQSQYREKYLEIYVKHFIMRMKEVLDNNDEMDAEIDLEKLKDSFHLLEKTFENEKLNDAMKVNKVLLDIFDNKLIKTNVEKQLSQNLKKGIPEYQTFLQF